MPSIWLRNSGASSGAVWAKDADIPSLQAMAKTAQIEKPLRIPNATERPGLKMSPLAPTTNPVTNTNTTAAANQPIKAKGV